MAVISSITTRDKAGDFAVAPTELTGTDSLVFNAAAVQTLYLRNDTVAEVTVTIDGDGVTAVSLPGQGRPIDNSAGYDIVLAAGETRGIVLSSIRNFLVGTVAVTGGAADVFAWIVEG